MCIESAGQMINVGFYSTNSFWTICASYNLQLPGAIRCYTLLAIHFYSRVPSPADCLLFFLFQAASNSALFVYLSL